jgi:hypothetical protein
MGPEELTRVSPQNFEAKRNIGRCDMSLHERLSQLWINARAEPLYIGYLMTGEMEDDARPQGPFDQCIPTRFVPLIQAAVCAFAGPRLPTNSGAIDQGPGVMYVIHRHSSLKQGAAGFWSSRPRPAGWLASHEGS